MTQTKQIEKMVDELAEKKLRILLRQLKQKADKKRKEIRENKLKKIMKHLENNYTITNRQIRSITDVSEMTAVLYLRQLLVQEKIKKMNRGRNVSYRLK